MKVYKNKEDNKIIITNDEINNSSMELITANTTDGAVEKHVPVVSVSSHDIKVTVGEVIHPMLDNHYIECIFIETNVGYQIKYLKPGDEPIAYFRLCDDDSLVNAYCYCNLHGLWKNND